MPLNQHNAEYHANRLPDRIERLRQWFRVRRDLDDLINEVDELKLTVSLLEQQVALLKAERKFGPKE